MPHYFVYEDSCRALGVEFQEVIREDKAVVVAGTVRHDEMDHIPVDKYGFSFMERYFCIQRLDGDIAL